MDQYLVNRSFWFPVLPFHLPIWLQMWGVLETSLARESSYMFHYVTVWCKRVDGGVGDATSVLSSDCRV